MDLKISDFTEDNINGLYICKTGDKPDGSALLIYGYGGNRLEMLPLAVEISRLGVACYLAGLPGHGDNSELFSLENVAKFMSNLEHFIRQKKVSLGIGHSVSARIIEHLPFETAILISPPGEISFDGDNKQLIQTLRTRRVKEENPYKGLREVLSLLNGKNPPNRQNRLILYAKNDLRSVKQEVSKFAHARCVKDSNHLDIINSLETIGLISKFLKRETIG